MTVRRVCCSVAFLAAASSCVFLTSAGASVQEPERTVWDGVYTGVQAQRGRTLYDSLCAGCHLENLSGDQGFPLRGDGFIDRWREDSLEALFGHMTTMPMNEDLAPAGPQTRLTDAAYLDLLAYILEVNAFPDGDEELSLDSIASTRLIGREGPQPLPSGASVLIVGCVVEGPDSVWMLSDTSEPIRTRRLVGTSDEELTASRSLPATDQTYQLRNLEVRGYDPVPYVGQKVQVKGELIREQGKDRVFVTSFDAVSPDCTP